MYPVQLRRPGFHSSWWLNQYWWCEGLVDSNDLVIRFVVEFCGTDRSKAYCRTLNRDPSHCHSTVFLPSHTTAGSQQVCESWWWCEHYSMWTIVASRENGEKMRWWCCCTPCFKPSESARRPNFTWWFAIIHSPLKSEIIHTVQYKPKVLYLYSSYLYLVPSQVQYVLGTFRANIEFCCTNYVGPRLD